MMDEWFQIRPDSWEAVPSTVFKNELLYKEILELYFPVGLHKDWAIIPNLNETFFKSMLRYSIWK